jgi:hypothetical protein
MRFLYLFFFMIYCPNLFSQITTSGIRGTVSLSSKPLATASVSITHLPTGSVSNTLTQKNGNYTLPNLQVGGPYKITITHVGLTTKVFENIFLTLGNFETLDADLAEQNTQLAGVVISSNINKRKKDGGISTVIGTEQINRMPTLNRSLQDLTKLSPQSNGNSFAGANYRFNNLSVDGAALNDAFGFTEPASGAGGSQATGSPGSLAKTQPISLEAIQEVQVDVSPYTVTLGNFTGGSVNVVTRSGTNKTTGSIFFTGRNQFLTGKSADDKRTKIDKYYDYQFGGRIGGAIVKNKLFYFAVAEFARRNEPVQFAPGTTGAAIPLTLAQALYDTVAKRYGYDLGTFANKDLQINSNKFFGRLDWNINSKHKVSLRHNYVNAFSNNLERSANVLNYGGQGYKHNSATHSTVLEIKSNFSNKLSNNLIIGRTHTNDSRDIAGNFFPHIEITFNTANTIFLGAYREAAVYGLKLKTTELTDNLTFYKGKHTFTFGMHHEFYNIDYRFLTAFNGRWAYRSPEDFYANRPSRIRGVYNLTNNDLNFNRNNPSAAFRVFLLSEYIQDEIAINKKLRLTAGIRLDHSIYPDREPVNAQVNATKGFENYNNVSSKAPQIAPRIGINWDVKGNQKFVIKAGSGIFNGRMPFAWLAYPYYNNGEKYGNIDFRPTTVIPLQTNGDVGAIAATYQSGIREINLLDNNYKLPQVWRNSLSVSYKTNTDWKFAAEVVYTKTLQDVLYKTINLKDSTAPLVGTGDNRTVYLGNGNAQKNNASFTNVFLLSNTNKGYRYQVSGTVFKEIKNFTASTTYTYGVSKDVSNGVRVSPQANWEFNQTILPNAPALSYSNFDLRHRSFTNLQYTRKGKKTNTIITLLYTTQSGTPFTYTYIGDINRDGSPNNDLIYIPKSKSESNLTDIKNAAGVVTLSADEQWNNLNNYISNDKYLRNKRGQYAERNGARTPWNHQLDMKIVQNFKIGKANDSKHFVSIALDVFNLSNLISKTWGRQYYVPNILNSSFQLLNVARANTATAPELNFNLPNTTPWQYDPLLSRTQGALTIRYTF